MHISPIKAKYTVQFLPFITPVFRSEVNSKSPFILRKFVSHFRQKWIDKKLTCCWAAALASSCCCCMRLEICWELSDPCSIACIWILLIKFCVLNWKYVFTNWPAANIENIQKYTISKTYNLLIQIPETKPESSLSRALWYQVLLVGIVAVPNAKPKNSFNTCFKTSKQFYDFPVLSM